MLNWIKHSSILLLIILFLGQSQHFHHHGGIHSHETGIIDSCEKGHNHPIHRHDNTCHNTHHITEDCNYCDWQQPLVNQSSITICFQQVKGNWLLYNELIPIRIVQNQIRINSNKAPPTV